jgi:3-hydroxyacyl-CoA dehydrogenase, NAD binding domain
MPTVAIVGAGLIGRSWAIVFARAGWEVRLTDPSAEALAAAPRLIREGLDELAGYNLVDNAAEAASRVSVAGPLNEAAAGVDLVQENGPERVEDKRRIFAELDQAAPADAVLASSTSAIVASKFTEGLVGRARCLVAHPVNPPHLVPIVELCGAPWTSPEIVARARGIYEAVGQAAITVNREIEGFVLNRLQVALLAEAFRLAGEGVVHPAGSRQDALRRARPALVLHGPVPDDRAQRAGRHPGLLRPVRGLLPPHHGRPAEAVGVGRSQHRPRHASLGAVAHERGGCAPHRLARQAPDRTDGAQARATRQLDERKRTAWRRTGRSSSPAR